MAKDEVSCKILILGESKVGKSSILNQFSDRSFTENLPPTLGIDYKIMKMLVEETDVKLQIWDTAGQERFRSITESFYRGCHGVLLVFDVTDRDTFDKIKGWIMNIHEKAGKNIMICIVGNKIDLKGGNGVETVSTYEVEELAQAHGVKYFLVSAKENINIHIAFEYLAKEIKQKIINSTPGNDGIKLNRNTKKSRGCCL